MSETNQLQNQPEILHRRQMLSSAARGIFAVAVVSAAATLKTKPAEAANCGNDKPVGNAQGCNCFLERNFHQHPIGRDQDRRFVDRGSCAHKGWRHASRSVCQ